MPQSASRWISRACSAPATTLTMMTIAVVLIVVGVGLFLYVRSRRKLTEIVISEGSREMEAGSTE